MLSGKSNDRIALQPAKAPLPIVVIPNGIMTSANLLQSRNIAVGITLRLGDKVALSSDVQPIKAAVPTVATLSGNEIDSKLMHPSKAEEAIVVTPFGIKTEFSFLQFLKI